MRTYSEWLAAMREGRSLFGPSDVLVVPEGLAREAANWFSRVTVGASLTVINGEPMVPLAIDGATVTDCDVDRWSDEDESADAAQRLADEVEVADDRDVAGRDSIYYGDLA